MYLKDCQSGHRVKLWVDSFGYISPIADRGYIRLEATIGAHSKGFTLLVWKPGETAAPKAYKLPNSMTSPPWDQVERDIFAQGVYTMGGWQTSDECECELISGSTATIIAQKHTKVEAGMACKRCHTFCHWSAPNQADGSFVCYSCRS